MLPPALAVLQQELQGRPSPAAARQVIEEYLAFTNPAGFRQELWELTAALLSHPGQPGAATAKERSDVLFFYEFTSLLIQAIQCFHNDSDAGTSVN